MPVLPFKGLLSQGQEGEAAREQDPTRQFNLLRWFSLVSLIIIATVTFGLGAISIRFVVNESVERDAMLTAQFIQTIAASELRHVGITGRRTMGEFLDTRHSADLPGASLEAQSQARAEFLDHVSHLPDALLVNIYAPDRVIIWSTNPDLIGKPLLGDTDLEEAFVSKERVASSFHKKEEGSEEQEFLHPPEDLVIENYIPLFDTDEQEVQAIVEVYKEPRDLIERMERGYKMIWLTTAMGGALIYFGLFWIVRRAAALLDSQQKQLLTNETYVLLGEMSSAVAHSLRNPLATIRSSAELAEELVEQPAKKNITDIISQVDRMSKWVRELLMSSRPLSGDSEAVDLIATTRDVLHSYEQQIANSGVQVELASDYAPYVVSQRVLLSQVLNSLMANALEAMPSGGSLKIGIEPNASARTLCMTFDDTGRGMTQQQQAMVFKPFFTTKQGGLGVGLMLVKRIMERFGGRVSLTSREHEGTSVKLQFKIAEGGEYGTQHTVG
ncbi:sensor histidine kinase [Pseudomonas schmalbachii]|uniref:histidine kinase n=1 Tax=Pseudomonas schmalbachii TaxID=2816993 RepID=A0ABS3TMI4_9PSED|nr:HAMP domain-containing sensor histidine kinase [Pseudomonas schmalbachii]MBO3273900.1 HAMP domain-containing histidine kinase [Pseudomonas schmalbachii]